MKRTNWEVGEFSVRPAGVQDECFYCGSKVGDQHKDTCVIKSRTVLLDCTVRVVMPVPECWEVEQIRYHYNNGSWCADNLLSYLEARNKNVKGCLCPITKVSFVREATREDEESFGWNSIDEQES